jgi:hypothetical protein
MNWKLCGSVWLGSNLPEEIDKSHKKSIKSVGVPAEILNKHLPNTRQNHYRLNQISLRNFITEAKQKETQS